MPQICIEKLGALQKNQTKHFSTFEFLDPSIEKVGLLYLIST